MGLLQEAARSILKEDLDRLEGTIWSQEQNNELLEERLAELELGLEDIGWLRLAGEGEQEFSRDALRRITNLARIMYLKNPLVQRGVNVKRFYVWGQSVTIQAVHEDVNELIQTFIDDVKNQVELTSHQARMMKEMELETDGNLFFVFFTNRSTGRVRLRTIPFSEVEEITCSPEDRKEPWFYRRSWTESLVNLETGTRPSGPRVTYHPDWRYNPTSKPANIGDKPILWDAPVYHVKVGGFSDWKFGVSEIYAAIDWARAYKEFLEDWASIVRSYRRFAWKTSGHRSKGEIAAMKSKLSSTLGSGGTDSETTPPPVAGSVAHLLEGRDLVPIRTSGATISADDGRRLLLMVAASVGLPETFFGDVSVGTLATAESLDRPTELAMVDRQALWRDVHLDIFEYVKLQAVKAANGPLRALGSVSAEQENGQADEYVEWKDDVDPRVEVTFPPLIERDIQKVVAAIVDAATLRGAPLAGTMKMKDASRLLLSALGVQDVDEILDAMYPEGEEEEPTEEAQARAVAGLKEALEELVSEYGSGLISA